MDPKETTYQEKYFEAKFKAISDKLNDIVEMLGAKASATAVLELERRLIILENSDQACPIDAVKTEVDSLKKKMDEVMDATEDLRFYKKRPKQLKMLVAGGILLFAIYVATLIPSYMMMRKMSKELARPTTEATK